MRWRSLLFLYGILFAGMATAQSLTYEEQLVIQLEKDVKHDSNEVRRYLRKEH